MGFGISYYGSHRAAGIGTRFLVVPKSAGELTNPVDHAGGGLSVVMISSFVLGIIFAPQGFSPVVAILFTVTLVTGIAFFGVKGAAIIHYSTSVPLLFQLFGLLS